MHRLLLAAAIAAAVAVSANAQPKTDNDVLSGEVWTFKASKGDLSRKGEFRIYDRKV